MTRSEQETARKHCNRLGVIEEKLKGVPATLYYRVNKSKVYELLDVQFAEIPQTEIAGTQQTSLDEGREFAGKLQSDVSANFNKETETSSRISSESEDRALDFKNMTVAEARKVPALRMYYQATDFFPGSLLWETVYRTITENNLTAERLHAAAVAWQGRGFKLSNIEGILEWAINGIPNSNSSKQEVKPGINISLVESTKQMIETKWDFEPAAPPDARPQIRQLAERLKK